MSAPAMNEYALMAHEHWKRFRPTHYASLPDRETFFATLGQQAQTEIETRAQRLAGADPAGEGYMQKLRRLETAKRTARDEVIREMILVTPEDEEAEQQAPHQA